MVSGRAHGREKREADPLVHFCRSRVAPAGTISACSSTSGGHFGLSRGRPASFGSDFRRDSALFLLLMASGGAPAPDVAPRRSPGTILASFRVDLGSISGPFWIANLS